MQITRVIHPKNLPPSFSWFHTAWLMVLTLQVFDLGDWATYAAIASGGTYAGFWVYHLTTVRIFNIFESLEKND